MCGDGANDCGALRAADVGLSLSDAEASIAAPFTSAVATIECAPRIIREGRAALTTSFACFKYISLYCLIQLFTLLVLFYYNTILSNYEFLWVDLFVSMPLAIFRTPPFSPRYSSII